MQNPNREDKPPDVELSPYAGRWVAIINQKVISQGGTPHQALLAAKSSRIKETPQIIFVPTKQPLKYDPPIDSILSALPKDMQIYLVGGAVRDAWLQDEIHDLDFIVPEDGLKVGRQVADRLKAVFYPLDEDRKTGRVLHKKPNGSNMVLDFSVQQGPDMESDLWARDFTINAIAIDVNHPQELIDPTSGCADLQSKQLRACTPDALTSDPIRIIRGVRLAAALEFHLVPQTKTLMRLAVPLIPNTSIERLRDELFRILEGPQVTKSMRALDILGVLEYLLPEIQTLKDVNQSPPHQTDVWQHTLNTLDCLNMILNAITIDRPMDPLAGIHENILVNRLNGFQEKLYIHFVTDISDGRKLRAIYNLAALYHDIGKSETQTIDSEGSIHFYRHENVGANIISYRAKKLRLSNAEIVHLKTIIKNHMRPLLLAQEKRKPSRRAIYRYFRDTGPAGVGICLLSLADTLATHDNSPPAKLWDSLLDVIELMFDTWFNQHSSRISPVLLVTGKDLIEQFSLDPGPLIGELLEAIREAQAEGVVHTQEEAMVFAHRYISQVT